MPIIAPATGVAGVGRRVTLGPLAFAVVQADGVEWIIEDVTGWDSGSASTLDILQKLRAPGGWRSSDPQLKEKGLVVSGTMIGPDMGSVIRACDALKSAATLAETTLTVDDPGYGPRVMRVSRQGEVLIKDLGETANTFAVSLVAADPRKFGPPVTGAARLPSTTGGFTYPRTFPHTINAVTVTGNTSLTNPGTMDGPVMLRIDGPLDRPVVTHQGPDGTRTAFGLSMSLQSGEFVTVDMEAQTVLAQGQSSRANSVSVRGWPAFRPGNNTWSLSASTVSPSALLTVTASPTWE